jgi:hypothetical protein
MRTNPLLIIALGMTFTQLPLPDYPDTHIRLHGPGACPFARESEESVPGSAAQSIIHEVFESEARALLRLPIWVEPQQ